MNITGGQNGQIIRVENLNPLGDLSLRHALTRNDIIGPRIIEFDVMGDIFGSIDTPISNVTINGQGKVCLRNDQNDMGDTLNFTGDNIILDSLRIRPGHANNVPSNTRRCLNFQGTKGAIIRNCSLTWGYDQLIGGWYGATDLWFIQNLIAEGFYDFGNSKYGMAGLFGDGEVYFYQNILAHNKGRNPKLNKGHLWNNLIYNPGDWVVHVDNRFFGVGQADVIGNVLIPGNQSNTNASWLVYTNSQPAEIYLQDNIGPKRNWWNENQTNGIVADGTTNLTIKDSPFITDIPFEIIPSYQLEDYLLKNVGAFPRDTTDRRIIDTIKNRDGNQIGNEANAGGYSDLSNIITPPIITPPKKVIFNIPFNVKAGKVTSIKFENDGIELEIDL